MRACFKMSSSPLSRESAGTLAGTPTAAPIVRFSNWPPGRQLDCWPAALSHRTAIRCLSHAGWRT
jgi:hypothetical protein